ncbi:MAG: DHA2 family efflux MFS transporter permease subunit [Sphingomonadaceae bacterium]|nr:DHA2 family efflux MFS transporter permease subunit [Sphingomonadaceae bacterium]
MTVTMAATMIVVLDTTIANVALPHMQAALGATPESVAWVLTSYILASAVALPLTGWLSDRIGRRSLFTVALAGFTVSSAVCGIAVTLPMMVAARIAQGLFGAFLAPMSQAIMYDINPREKHVQAMTLWGMVIMVGPIMGPVLGGWITDNYDWRWVFYINVPIGTAAAFASWALLADVERKARPFDLFGFLLLAAALSSTQLMLDRGVQLDWFDSTEIWIELAIAVGAAWMFVVHTATRAVSLLPRALFADRNFVTAIMAMTVLGGILMAGAALVAPMLQRLLGYPVLQAGLLTAPRGVGTMIGMLVAGRLSKYVDPRMTIATGMALLAASLWIMTGFETGMDDSLVLWSGAIQGVGLGFTVLPMNLLALATLPQRLRTEAASLYNLTRSIGGSIAISVTTALLASNVQANHVALGGAVSTTRAPFLNVGLFEQLGLRGESVLQMIDVEVNKQALMIAYVDDYWLMMWAAVLVMPLVLLMRGPRPGAVAPPPDAH